MIEVAQWKNDSFFPPLCGDGFHRTTKPLYSNMGCKLCVGIRSLGRKTFNICNKVVEFPEKFAISIPMPRIIPLGWNTFKEAKGENEYFRIAWLGPMGGHWDSGPDCLGFGDGPSGPPDHASQPMFLPNAHTVIDNYKIFSYQSLELDESGQINKSFSPPTKSVNLAGICGASDPYNITLGQEYTISGGLTCNPDTEEVRFLLTIWAYSVSSGPVCNASMVGCGGVHRLVQEYFHINWETPRRRTFDIPEELFFEPATNSNVKVFYRAEDGFSNLGGLTPFPCAIDCCLGRYKKYMEPADPSTCPHVSDITRTTVSYIPLEA